MDDVRLAIGGDRAAFGRLYARYSRAVFVDLASRLRLREDAEDALQTVFLAAWVHLPRLARPERFLPWLFRIARNKARDLLRRRRRSGDLGDGRDLIAPGGAEAEEAGIVRRLVDGLRPETRTIVLLRALEGWSAEEVAAAQGTSAATVRRRYARALEHLRRALDRRMTDDGTRRAHCKSL